MADNPGGHRWGPRAALGAIVLLVLVSRLLQARESLWLDELHTAWAASGAWSEVARRAAEGNQAPVFFWVVWGLAKVLGMSELTVRLPSLLAGALLPVALYAVARRWTGDRWLALLPAWLVAVDPQAIYFGTEARPYALIQLIAVIHVGLFAELVERPSVALRVAFVAGAAVLFHLHYTTLLLPVAEVSYLAIRSTWLRPAPAYRWRFAAIDVGAIGALLALALPTLAAVYSRRDNWKSFVDQRPAWEAVFVTPWAATALVAIAFVWFVGARRSDNVSAPNAGVPAQSTRNRWLALCWLVVPLAAVWVATATDSARLLHPRYVAAAAPAAPLLIVLAISAAPRQWQRLGLAAIVATVALTSTSVPRELVERHRLIAWRTDDWRAALAFFSSEPGHERDPVVVRSLLLESDALGGAADKRLREYSLLPVTSLYRIDAGEDRLIPVSRAGAARLADADRRTLLDAPGFWMIVGAGGVSPAAVELQFVSGLAATSAELDGRNRPQWTIVSNRSFGTVRVARFERTPWKQFQTPNSVGR